jgi:hypothetical protein
VRRRVRWAGAAVAAVVAAGCSAPATPALQATGADQRLCDGETCISVEQFGRALDDEFAGKVVGYTVLVGGDEYSGGWARKEIDPPAQQMGPGVFVNSASIGKTFTAIEVLDALARHGVDVDAPIGPYLPPDWIKGPGIEQVTFAQLLTHAAGFRVDSNRILTDDDVAQEQVAVGVRAEDPQTPVYNNINFSIFRDLLPYLEGQPDPGPGTRSEVSDAFFVAAVQRDVLAPSGVTDAVCAAVEDGVLLYSSVADKGEHGQPVGGGPQGCSPGGWSITPADILKVENALLDGELLPEDTRASMDELGLGWDRPSPVRGEIVGKFGEYSQMQTFMGAVMDQLPLVVAINSDADTVSLFTVLQRAYQRAIVS